MRAHFGYNEVEMAIRDLIRNEPVPEPVITSGRALRFWEEMYLDDEPGVVTTPETEPADCAAALA